MPCHVVNSILPRIISKYISSQYSDIATASVHK